MISDIAFTLSNLKLEYYFKGTLNILIPDNLYRRYI